MSSVYSVTVRLFVHQYSGLCLTAFKVLFFGIIKLSERIVLEIIFMGLSWTSDVLTSKFKLTRENMVCRVLRWNFSFRANVLYYRAHESFYAEITCLSVNRSTEKNLCSLTAFWPMNDFEGCSSNRLFF